MRMVSRAQEAGQLFFAAAGNSGSNNDIYPFYPSGYWQDIVTSVASTRRDQQISTFSNYGAFTVDLGAPGEDIWSTYPVSLSGQPDPFNPGAPVDTRPYKELSGTSMATPLVAGEEPPC